jgi:hypothetical protein
MAHPEETLPDPAPLPTFFLPNILGIGFALAMEKLGLEQFLRSFFAKESHPYCLLGLGIFAVANCNSYLGGSVVRARIEYGVKLPNLYASKNENKNAVSFNCVQRGHQNFLENYAQLALFVLFTALVANRPNTAGMILIVVSACRVLYAMQYRLDITSRIGPFLGVILATNIGVGYAFLVGVSAFGIHLFTDE